MMCAHKMLHKLMAGVDSCDHLKKTYFFLLFKKSYRILSHFYVLTFPPLILFRFFFSLESLTFFFFNFNAFALFRFCP